MSADLSAVFDRHLSFGTGDDALSRRPANYEAVHHVEPLEVRPDAILNPDRIEAALSFGGVFKPPRDREVPPQIEALMDERMPQFFLRNLRRVEREPDERMPFEAQDADSVRKAAASARAAVEESLRYQPPELLDSFGAEAVAELRTTHRRILRVEPWTRRFGKEIKSRLTSPMWKYDPDGAGP